MTQAIVQAGQADRDESKGDQGSTFPIDIAMRASNLVERAQVVAHIISSSAADADSGQLSDLQRRKIQRLASRLAAQLENDPLIALRFAASPDGIEAILSSFARHAINASHIDPRVLDGVETLHRGWLAMYRAALERYEPSALGGLCPRWSSAAVSHGRFARACEPFLLEMYRQLEEARLRANGRMDAPVLAPSIVDGFLDLLLDRFDLALAWAIEADMSVYCARRGIDKRIASPDEFVRYFEETFGDAARCHRFYKRFPVLGRWLAIATTHICRNGHQIFERLEQDVGEVGARLLGAPISEVVSLALGKSDYHAAGQAVAIVGAVVAGGKPARFVYKPRSLGLEAGMQKLLAHLREHGVQAFATRAVIDRGSYGYEELVPSGANRVSTRAEAEAIYEELGGYLGIFHVLGGGDLHYENVLVAAGHAYVCDCETLLGVRLAGREPAVGTVLDSVYKTGLLEWPRGDGAGGEAAMRISGYAGGESYELPVPVPRIGPDRMSLALGVRYERGVRVDLDGSNRVYLGDQLLSPTEFTPAIVNGFRRVHQWFEGCKAEAARMVAADLGEGWVRYVNWATQVYVQLLVEARHPKCLMDPLEVDLVFNRLRQHPRTWDAGRELAEREITSLWQLDVPMFTVRAGGGELVHDHAHALPVGLAASPVDDATSRIARLSEANERRQVQYIGASLAGTNVHSPEFVETALGYARSVGVKLCSLLQDPAGGSPWKSYEIGSADYRDVDILSDLYNGTAGVALFLAYLDALAPAEEFRARARHALAHALAAADPERIGAFQGAGGLVYVLTHLSHLWHDEGLLDRAVDLSRDLAAHVARDREFDVLSGVAGLIPVMLGLAEARPNEGLACAHACARHLLAHAVRGERGLSWPLARPEEADANLPGFAHGSSGIGWALILLGHRTGCQEYVDAGREAFEYEKLFFDEEKQDWYDIRTSVVAMARGRRTFSNSWCNGAAGIGLSRIASWATIGKHDDGMLRDAYAALAATARNFHRLGNDSLCHGRSGNAELFLRFALLKEDAAFQLEANVQGQAQWQSLEEDQALAVGGAGVPVFPGLMLGLAGFGLHFLRLAYPDRVPSPLLLDPPIPVPAQKEPQDER